MQQKLTVPADGAREPSDFAGGNQHPVMQIPFNVILNGRSYAGSGLSVVMAYAKGLSAPQLEGQRRMATLEFNFGSYAVNLPVETVVESVSSESGLLTLRFVDPTGPHLPQLRYLLNAFVDGELTAIDGLLNATAGAGPDKKAPPLHVRRSARFIVGQAVKTLAVIAVTAVLAVIVLNGAYNRFFVIEAKGVSMVAAGGMTLRAVSPGQIDFVNPKALKGQPLFSIRATSGDVITVSMPCDCIATPTRVVAGSTVLAGDPVITVAATTDAPVVKTALNAAALNALAGGATALIVLPDGREVQVSYTAATVTSAPGSAAEVSDVILAPASGLVAGDVGSPVQVRVETARSRRFAALHNFIALIRQAAASAI